MWLGSVAQRGPRVSSAALRVSVAVSACAFGGEEDASQTTCFCMRQAGC